MKFIIKTEVNTNIISIYDKFNQQLFEKLTPPAVQLEILRFDGCNKNDEIHLKMNILGLISNDWKSIITSSFKSNDLFYFIDEGILLPAPLKYWKHVHRVEKIAENKCYVIDEIEFSSNNKLIDFALYPALYAMFSLRIPIYKSELL